MHKLAGSREAQESMRCFGGITAFGRCLFLLPILSGLRVLRTL
jgi:hypothetical protein